MIRYACNPPRQNAESIVNIGFPSLGFAAPVADPLAGFGITIDKEMAVIPGRELAPPGLNYKVGDARVANGSWNILNVKFHKGAIIGSWYVLVVRDGENTFNDPEDPQLVELVNRFATKLRKSGMSIPNGHPSISLIGLMNPAQDDDMRSRSVQLLRDTLESVGKQGFILILLENRDNYIYPAIKVSF